MTHHYVLPFQEMDNDTQAILAIILALDPCFNIRYFPPTLHYLGRLRFETEICAPSSFDFHDSCSMTDTASGLDEDIYLSRDYLITSCFEDICFCLDQFGYVLLCGEPYTLDQGVWVKVPIWKAANRWQLECMKERE